jgi:uncharacterized protein (TIGR01777 family)
MTIPLTDVASSTARQPRRIVLAGGSGQVGNLLAQHFHSCGDDVVVFARGVAHSPWRVVPWDGATLGNWTRELENADLLMNLAGRSVNCRYNDAHRRAIMESRVRTTTILGTALAQLAHPPRIWMNASTATIYRHALDRDMDEKSGEIGGDEPGAPPTWRFSIEVAKKWEEAFFSAPIAGVRKVALRSAMTMSPDRGGIFDALLRLVRFGLGGTAGSGKQFISWIHGDDFSRAIEFLINHDEIDGAVNISSPHPLPNREFMRDLREAWGTNIGLPAAEWMLAMGAIFLRTETELILKSRRVVPGRLQTSGFQFQFPRWPDAARDLIARWRKSGVDAR